MVLHTFSDAPAILAEHMSKLIEMPVYYAEDGMKIKGGQVLLARSDNHLLVKEGILWFSIGPKAQREFLQALY